MPSKRISLLAFYHNIQNSGLSLIKTPNKMKLIVNSKTLSRALSTFNLDSASIESVSIDDGEFTISSREWYTSFFVESNTKKAFIKQGLRRWDHLKSLLKEVEEQPIVIEIEENKLEVKFQY